MTCGWYLHGHEGTLYAQGDIYAKNYTGRRVKSSDVVTCILAE